MATWEAEFAQIMAMRHNLNVDLDRIRSDVVKVPGDSRLALETDLASLESDLGKSEAKLEDLKNLSAESKEELLRTLRETYDKIGEGAHFLAEKLR